MPTGTLSPKDFLLSCWDNWFVACTEGERYSFNVAVTARFAVSFLQAGGGLGDHQSTAVVTTADPGAHVRADATRQNTDRACIGDIVGLTKLGLRPSAMTCLVLSQIHQGKPVSCETKTR